MSATVKRTKAHNPDNAYAYAACGACGWKGSPQPVRTVEGWALAVRDRDDHNRVHHAPDTTKEN